MSDTTLIDVKAVIALVNDCGEDAQPDSEYRRACDDLVEALSELLPTQPAEMSDSTYPTPSHNVKDDERYRVASAIVANGVGELSFDQWSEDMQTVFLRQADAAIAATKAPPSTSLEGVDPVTIEACARLIEENIIMDTSAGKVLAPRQEGNRDGLHYASAIRVLGTNHGCKSDLHPEYVTPAGDA